jgi:hypothetical protein
LEGPLTVQPVGSLIVGLLDLNSIFFAEPVSSALKKIA